MLYYITVYHLLCGTIASLCHAIQCPGMQLHATWYSHSHLPWAITTEQSRRVLELHRSLFGCTVFVLPASFIMLCYATLLTAPIHLLTSTCMVLPLTFALVYIDCTVASGMTYMLAVETNKLLLLLLLLFLLLCYAMLCYAILYHTTCSLLTGGPVLSALCYAMSWYAIPCYMIVSFTFALGYIDYSAASGIP